MNDQFPSSVVNPGDRLVIWIASSLMPSPAAVVQRADDDGGREGRTGQTRPRGRAHGDDRRAEREPRGGGQ